MAQHKTQIHLPWTKACLSPRGGGGRQGALLHEKSPWRRATRGWLDLGQVKLPRVGADRESAVLAARVSWASERAVECAGSRRPLYTGACERASGTPRMRRTPAVPDGRWSGLHVRVEEGRASTHPL